MIVLHLAIQGKSEHIAEFPEVVRHDAEHLEKDEPGCLRFDALQDRDDPNRFYFYEVYRDQAALEARRHPPISNLNSKRANPGLPPRRNAASPRT